MENNLESKNIEQLLAEADELIRRINSDVIKYKEEGHRLLAEKHAQKLKMIQAEIQSKMENPEASKIGSGADGMHEAINDMIKAMKSLKEYLF